MLVARDKCFVYTDPFMHSIEMQSPQVNYHVRLDYIMPIKGGSHVEFHTLDKEHLHVRTDMRRVRLNVASHIEGAIDYGKINAVNSLIRDMQVTVMNHIYMNTDTVTFRYNTKLKQIIHKWFGIGKAKKFIYKLLRLTDAVTLRTLADVQNFFDGLLIKYNYMLAKERTDKYDCFIIVGLRHVSLLTLLPRFQVNSYGGRSHNMLPFHLGTLHDTKVYVDPELELNDPRIVIGHRPRSLTTGTVVVYTNPEVLETFEDLRQRAICQAQAHYSIVDLGQPTKYYSVDVEYKSKKWVY